MPQIGIPEHPQHPQHPAMPPALLKPAHAQRVLGISDETLYRLIAAGHIPAFKVGRSTFVRTSEALAYLTSHPLRLTRKAPAAKAVAA